MSVFLYYNFDMSKFYKQSGVNLDEAKNLTRKIHFSSFVGDTEYAGLKIYNCCDGIGSKIIPLYEHKLYKTIAIDLIAANLNDMATKNAEAVAFSDYIAVNKLNSGDCASIINELSYELKKYDCKLVGGETSEIPTLIREGMIDICGFAIGVGTEPAEEQVIAGDMIIGLKSSGIHANGFSLIRKLYSEKKLCDEDFMECLSPSYVYYNAVRKLWDAGLIKACANITGGGIISNLKRIIPEGLDVKLYYSAIPTQPIYNKLYRLIGDEMFDVFNCGVGFCIAADKKHLNNIFEICSEFTPFEFGEVI